MLGRSHAQEFDDHSSGAQKALFAGRNRAGRRSQSCVSGVAPPDRMLLLVGIVATLLYVSMTHAHAEPFAYLLAHGLKIVGGAGGFAAQRRATVFRA